MSKAQRAAAAIAENPQMSNRAIAKELGVDEGTVRKSRSTADHSADDGEPRPGLDGKARRMPVRREEDEYDHGLAIEQTKQSVLLDAHEPSRFGSQAWPKRCIIWPFPGWMQS